MIARRLGFIKVKRGAADAATSLDEAALALADGRGSRHLPRRPPHPRPDDVAGAGQDRIASGWRCERARRSSRWRWSALIGSSASAGVVPTLLRNLIRRPKVDTRVGAPIDVRALMNIGPTTEPTVDEVRLAADAVMGRLVAVVADLRGERPPNPDGVPRAAD